MTPMNQIVPGFNLPVTVYTRRISQHVQPDGTVTTRWHLSLKERLLIAMGGSLWLQVLTFNRPLQPVKLTAQCPIHGHTGHDEEA